MASVIFSSFFNIFGCLLSSFWLSTETPAEVSGFAYFGSSTAGNGGVIFERILEMSSSGRPTSAKASPTFTGVPAGAIIFLNVPLMELSNAMTALEISILARISPFLTSFPSLAVQAATTPSDAGIPFEGYFITNIGLSVYVIF
ncbi:MAG TPA: hypothetical protein PKW71_12815, partial [Anaerohalosphaeraceae bacterium]|nr:hypothetical protein [Anaerohalosphaeraceae bacterium]